MTITLDGPEPTRKRLHRLRLNELFPPHRGQAATGKGA